MVNDSELRNQQVGQSGMQTGGDFEDMIMDDNELAEALREEGVSQGEALEARQIPDVPQPSKQERKAHELLHMLYRVWCSDCVKGRGMGTQHRKCTRTEKRGVSQVAMDYFFPAPNLTCVAVKDVDSQAVMASVVPKKGGGNIWTVRQIKNCIDNY